MIYFIQNALTFRIKIGYTGKDDPTQRLADLQTGSDALLYLLATREGSMQSEKDLHKQFAKYSADQGEWFNPGPELIQYIVACAALKMGKEAMAIVVDQLAEESFPETKTELRNRAVSIMASMREEGFVFSLSRDGNPAVTPFQKVTPEQMKILKQCKPMIKAILEEEAKR